MNTNTFPGLVALCGPRVLPDACQPHVAAAVQALLAANRRLGVGCAVGSDAQVIEAVLAAQAAASLTVFCAFGPAPDFSGAWRQSATDAVAAAQAAGALVVPWAGGVSADRSWGGSTGLAARLARRSRALVAWCRSGGAGSGLIAFVVEPPPRPLHPATSWMPCGSDTWSTIALAAGMELPVVVFPADRPATVLPAWSGGRWVIAGRGLWRTGWRWLPTMQSEVQHPAGVQRSHSGTPTTVRGGI